METNQEYLGDGVNKIMKVKIEADEILLFKDNEDISLSFTNWEDNNNDFFCTILISSDISDINDLRASADLLNFAADIIELDKEIVLDAFDDDHETIIQITIPRNIMDKIIQTYGK